MAAFTQIFVLLLVSTGGARYASQTAPEGGANPKQQVLGTITSVNQAAHTITVKDDKSAAEVLVSTANTKTLIKVLPGAKDLKGAIRITTEDLAAGDRVDVRGVKDDAYPNAIAARSIVLMSARELQAKHQAEAAAWQNSTAGVVALVDPTAHTIVMTVRGAGGSHPVTVQVPDSAEITRYSPENPKTPGRSELAEIQPGDQVRVIGTKSETGDSIAAERVYSGAFRTIAGTVTSLGPDGKGFALRDLQSKQAVQIALNDSSTIRKIPPEMAAMLASRMNGGGGGGGGSQGGAAPAGQPPSAAPQEGAPEHPRARGDLSQLVQRLPAISLTDLKPGDAVIVSGVLSGNKSQVIATNIIAGVEPMFQSQAAGGGGRQGQGQSLGSWSLGDIQAPTQ